jgi:diguanylate cyclase (GGDEF)-like protein
VLVQTLDGITTESYEEARRREDINRVFSAYVARALSAGTVVGLLLMSGLALLLVRHNRAAASAALASMTALEQAALTDSLTGLGNHRAFYDDLRREIARTQRHGHPLALALIDIDDFKAINDGGGHARGDDVLADLGEHLSRLGRGDRAYRIGGDEFAVLLVEADPAGARAALSRLHGEFRKSLSGATVSIGYVDMGPEDDVAAFELADAALYEAKRRGRDNVVCFEEIRNSVDMFSTRKGELLKKLLDESGVTTAFQPIWDIETTRPFGFEALARPFPQYGFAGPQDVFDVAERKRLLPELDRLCIGKALEAARSLPLDTLIFLNIAPASLACVSFDANEFVARVRAAGLSEHRIVVELTERRIDDTTTISARARELRALGVRLALDDTGSGHAGLDILSKVRFDFVKIDRILLTRAATDPSARGVVSGIIAIARETGSYLIAEGIETPELLDFVGSAHVPSNDGFSGIRGVQGYLLGRPAVGALDVVSLKEHHDFLAARRPMTIPTIRSTESVRRHEAPLTATAS